MAVNDVKTCFNKHCRGYGETTVLIIDCRLECKMMWLLGEQSDESLNVTIFSVH